MKRFIYILALLPLMTIAQTAQEEIYDNINVAGSNYLAYRTPTWKLTPTPKGYEPYYLSHYARHGSRWLCGSGEYARPVEKLQKAKQYGKLTNEGLEVLRLLEKIQATSTRRCGDLTTVGERQHQGIGKR